MVVIPARLPRYAKHCGQAEAGIQNIQNWIPIFMGMTKNGITKIRRMNKI